jgi:3alpha(or 20beta)-hydroxysteroid dehydrogenase
MKGSLDGRVVLVTGAGRGLGAATAQACRAAGARVVLTDVDAETVAATAAPLGGALALQHDVADAGSWARVEDEVRDAFGRLDGLVNNAGVYRPLRCADGDVDGFRRSLDVNLTGTFLGIQAFTRLAPSGGSIVNLASVRGFVSGDGMAAYSAAKFGVRGLTRSAAIELGPRGIRVNSICPGHHRDGHVPLGLRRIRLGGLPPSHPPGARGRPHRHRQCRVLAAVRRRRLRHRNRPPGRRRRARHRQHPAAVGVWDGIVTTVVRMTSPGART